MPSQATDGINAITTLLLSLEDSRLASRITEKVSEALKPAINKINEATNHMKDATDRMFLA
jgi:hypothetical protein